MSQTTEQPLQDSSLFDPTLTFHLQTRATAASSRALVRATLRIISENILDEELVYFFQLALFEACSNVVCHAYPQNEPGELCVTLRVIPGQFLEAVVRDWGVGFPSLPVTIKNPPPDVERGRGLFIISQSADEFEIKNESPGVSVTIVKNMKEEQWIPYE